MGPRVMTLNSARKFHALIVNISFFGKIGYMATLLTPVFVDQC